MKSSKMNQNFEDSLSILQEKDMVIGQFNINFTFKNLIRGSDLYFQIRIIGLLGPIDALIDLFQI